MQSELYAENITITKSLHWCATNIAIVQIHKWEKLY